MNDIELGWVAGILEGEGYFCVYKVRPDPDDTYYQISIRCNMTDEDVIRRLLSVVGAGRVRGPYENKGKGTKPMFAYELQRRRELIPLLEAIRPHMGERRGAKIDEMLRIHYSYSKFTRTWAHGSRRKYELGCRCEECRDTHNARMRECRARRNAKRVGAGALSTDSALADDVADAA